MTRLILARVQWHLWCVAYAAPPGVPGPDRGRLERLEAYLISRLGRRGRSGD